METETKKILDELGRAFEEFKSANDERIKQLETKGTVDPALQAKVDKANQDVERFTSEKNDLLKRLDQIETKMNRPEFETKDGKKIRPEERERKAAFRRYMCKGEGGLSAAQLERLSEIPLAVKERFEEMGMSEMEIKALSVGSQPDGGYWVEPETSSRVVTKVFETSPLRPLATVESIGSDALEIPEDLNEAASGGWVGEQSARTETGTPAIGMRRIPVHEQYAMPKATQKLLDDAMFNIEEWLSRKVSDKFSREENLGFVSGTGVTRPRGFLTYPAGTTNPGQIEQVNSGAAALPTGDGIIKIFYSLKDPYAARAVWAMKRTTVMEVRLLKDSGTPGQYLWQPGLQAGQPDLLLGRPIVRFEDMPAVAAGALAIALADWREAYTIVDRIGIRTLRDPYTAKPFVLFYTTKRVGGDMVNFEAIKIQKIAA